MAETWRATVDSKGVVHESPTVRLIRVRTHVEIYDDAAPTTVIKGHSFETKYPIDALTGMTMIEVRDAIVENGTAGVPSLRSIAEGMLVDWTNSSTIRSIPLPFDFSPP
jgi:hypothetical protein